jgi:flagellar motor switch protein FliM
MEKVLSQEEIDALLRGIDDGKIQPAPEPVNDSGIAPYRFENQERISRDRMPLLEIINNQFVKLFRNTLSSTARRTIEVSPKGVEMVKLSQFISTLPVPSSLHVFKMDPLPGNAFMVLESKLIFTLLDLFFGGSGKAAYSIEGREFTAIEMRFIQKLVAMIFCDLEKSWQSVHPVRFNYVRTEINPQFLQIAPLTSQIILVSFAIMIEEFTGAIDLCIPSTLLDPIKNKLYSGRQKEQSEADHHWREAFTNCLKESEVEIVVELGTLKMTIENLLGLEKGDVLMLDKDASQSLLARIQGVPKFLGKGGLCGSNKAIQIEKRLEPLQD